MSTEAPSNRSGEYVLGTMPGGERAAFEKELVGDADLRAEVRAWEVRLAPLAALLPTREPPPRLWAEIEKRIDQREDKAPRDWASISRLRRSVRRWRAATVVSGGLAAALASIVFISVLRPTLRTDRGYVAIVNRGGTLPALIVRVDLDRGSVHVRSVDAQTSNDHSLELWYVADGEKPSSLGVISSAAEDRPLPAVLRGSSPASSQIAVSIEPKGGSSTGSPTGPIVYSGKLIKAEP